MSDGLRPIKRPGGGSCGLTMRRRSLLPEDGRTQLGQAILDIPGHLTIALGGRLDAERPQQRGGVRCRVAVVAEDGVKLGRDGNTAGVGDLVQARRNAWELVSWAGNAKAPINRETVCFS